MGVVVYALASAAPPAWADAPNHFTVGNISDWMVMTLISAVVLIVLFFIWISLLHTQSNRRKQAEQRLRTLVDSSPVCMHEIDLDGALISMNQAGLNMMGIKDSSEIRGLKYIDIVLPDDRPYVAKLMKKAKRGEGSAFEFSAVRDNRVVHYSSSFEPITDKHGNVIKLMGVTQDITDSKNAEKALELHNHTLMHLHELTLAPGRNFEEKVDQLLALGTELFDMPMGIISHINGESYQIKYVKGPEWAPKPGTILNLGNTYCALILKDNEPTAISNVGASEIAVHPCYKDFCLESYIGIKLSVGDEPYGTLNFTSPDIRQTPFSHTELSLMRLFANWISSELERERYERMIVQAKADAEKANEAKSEFLSTVSHELRTPLTSLKGSLGLITSEALGEMPDQVKKMFRLASKNTDRLTYLVNDILDVEKLLSGAMKMNMEQLDVSRMVVDAVHENQGFATEYGVRFVIQGAHEQLTINGDKHRLTQVIANLLSNAAKFSPTGEKIDITVARHNGCARVSVTDRGNGIPEQFHDRVFERFSQADGSDTRTNSGTGLGLNISRSIIELHHGTIDFETSPKTGTTFYFDLEIIS